MTYVSKMASLRHVSNKVLSAQWPHWTCGNIMFLSKSAIRLCFAIKTSIFKFRPLLRFLCLINSFYGRYVSSMYNRSNRLTRFDRFNATGGQQSKTYFFHSNNLTVAKGWFSQFGLEGGARLFQLLSTIIIDFLWFDVFCCM